MVAILKALILTYDLRVVIQRHLDEVFSQAILDIGEEGPRVVHSQLIHRSHCHL